MLRILDRIDPPRQTRRHEINAALRFLATVTETSNSDFYNLYTLLTAQSFHGSNSACPAIATANGLKVCNTFAEAA